MTTEPSTGGGVNWVDARRRSPADGELVLGAITGRYPPEPGRRPSAADEFWLVLPMHFHLDRPDSDSSDSSDQGADQPVRGFYVDADRVARRAYGLGATREEVTHWTLLPTLPGTTVRQIVGPGAGPARQRAQD